MAYSECVLRRIREKSRACFWAISSGKRPGPRILLRNEILEKMSKVVDSLSGDIALRKKMDRVFSFPLNEESCQGLDKKTMQEVIDQVQAQLDQEEFNWELSLLEAADKSFRVEAKFFIKPGAFCFY